MSKNWNGCVLYSRVRQVNWICIVTEPRIGTYNTDATHSTNGAMVLKEIER